MDFSEYKKIAEIWVGSHQHIPVQLLFDDETERLLVFTAGGDGTSVSFNVGCPRPNGSNKFKVWSEKDDTAVYLYQMQDFLESCKEKSLKEVLDTALKTLKPVIKAPGAAAAASGGGDSEDEAFEDQDEMDFEEEDDDGYYEEQETFTDEIPDPVVQAPASNGQSSDPLDQELKDQFGNCRGNATSVHRLLADLKQIRKCGNKFGFVGNPRGDNLFVWDVKLIDFEKKSRLGKDLAKYSEKYKEEPIIHLEVKFPETYPMSPPFLRVVKPRFKFLTGHITIGGSICMELLTTSGWRPTNDVEGILVQVRSEIMSDPNAQLDDMQANKPYSEDEARRAFARMVQRYGWNK
ncbi:uncharacterized protein [Amphiura filiformis]|uniref:uncharacterized protein n=1 Tax=Amphiura filiformis TaxID=82378 RepID=UPI003B214849